MTDYEGACKAMGAESLGRGIRSIVFVVVAILISLRPVEARDQGDARHLADSLATVYERSEGEVTFDASTARLEDYLVYAAMQSPALKAAFYRWNSILQKSGYTGALPDPWISYVYYFENVETQENRATVRIMPDRAIDAWVLFSA